MIPSDGSPLAASAQPCTTPSPALHAELLASGDAPADERQARLEHDHLVQMVAACLTAGLLTVAEVSGRSEEEVCALIAERSPHLDLLGPRRRSQPPRRPRRRRVDPDETLRAS